MVRTQVQLTELQARSLKEISVDLDVSVAEVIRQAVDRMIREHDRRARRQRALALLGRFDLGATDVATNHDAYLTEAYDADADDNNRS